MKKLILSVVLIALAAVGCSGQQQPDSATPESTAVLSPLPPTSTPLPSPSPSPSPEPIPENCAQAGSYRICLVIGVQVENFLYFSFQEIGLDDTVSMLPLSPRLVTTLFDVAIYQTGGQDRLNSHLGLVYDLEPPKIRFPELDGGIIFRSLTRSFNPNLPTHIQFADLSYEKSIPYTVELDLPDLIEAGTIDLDETILVDGISMKLTSASYYPAKEYENPSMEPPIPAYIQLNGTIANQTKKEIVAMRSEEAIGYVTDNEFKLIFKLDEETLTGPIAIPFPSVYIVQHGPFSITASIPYGDPALTQDFHQYLTDPYEVSAALQDQHLYLMEIYRTESQIRSWQVGCLLFPETCGPEPNPIYTGDANDIFYLNPQNTHMVLYSTANHNILMIDLIHDKTWEIFRGPIEAINATWTPDGDKVAVLLGPDTIALFEVGEQGPKQYDQITASHPADILWQPTGGLLFSAQSPDEASILIQSYHNGTLETLVSGIQNILVSGPDRQAYQFEKEGSMWIFDAATGAIRPGEDSSRNTVVWSPDGEYQITFARDENSDFRCDVLLTRLADQTTQVILSDQELCLWKFNWLDENTAIVLPGTYELQVLTLEPLSLEAIDFPPELREVRGIKLSQ